MMLTPFAIVDRCALFTPKDEQTLEGVDIADGLNGSVLIIGFGRFGQIVSQPLLLRGVDVSIIDNDVEMIQAAADFGFKVYYGDGTRLDILHAAGAGRARAVLICVDKAEAAVTHRREHEGGIPAGAGAGARLRPRRRARADQCRRRLPDTRDVRIGACCSAARRWRSWASTEAKSPRSSRMSAAAMPSGWNCRSPVASRPDAA